MSKKRKKLLSLVIVALIWTVLVCHCAYVEGIHDGRQMEAQAITAVFAANMDNPGPFTVPQLGKKGLEFCIWDGAAVVDIAERQTSAVMEVK